MKWLEKRGDSLTFKKSANADFRFDSHLASSIACK